MPQINQIVPRFSFSYVETVINDNTLVDDTLSEASVSPYVSYVFAFTSGQGIDNKFIRKRKEKSFVNTFGKSNYRKYGQPLMMPLLALQNPNAEVWAMRVMPENAAYANTLISVGYKADTADEYPDASKRKFRIRFQQRSVEDLNTEKAFKEAFKEEYTGEAEGYTVLPIMGLRSNGRGKYGNDYTLKIGQNLNYEKETGIKMYNFDILSVTSGLEKIANYVGAAVSSTKYDVATHIDDVLLDGEEGLAPVIVTINDVTVESMWEAYIAFAKEQHVALQDEYDSKLEAYAVPDGMLDGTVEVTEEYEEQVAELLEIKAMLDATANEELPDIDGFDPFLGIKVASSDYLPCIQFIESAENADDSAEDYDPNNYTSLAADEIPAFGSVKGVEMAYGSDGDFDSEDAEVREAAIEAAYIAAFDGTYDRRILSSRRIPASALFDAGYPFSVKCVLADLVTLRNDGLLYLDCGIDMEEFTADNVKSLIKRYSIFDTRLISINTQSFVTRESSTGRRVRVSITYDLVSHFTDHVINTGSHVPMVKARCQLTDNMRDSLAPTVEDYETELKETLYTNRFNFYETLSENTYQRACQNTSQKSETDMIEESNVHNLYTIKRIIESDVQARLYDFTSPAIRSTFSAYEQAKFDSWVNNQVESIDIYFSANAWEEAHSIIHCYVAVVFRGLQKRCILEIDINKRSYTPSLAAGEALGDQQYL